MTSVESQSRGESLDGFMSANKKIFFYLGFWPVNNEPHNVVYYWRSFFPRFCFWLTIGCLLFVQFYDLYLIRENWLFVCEEFMIISLLLLAMVLIWVCIYKMDDHKSLILFLQELNQPERLTNDTQRQMSEKTQWICNIFSIGIHVVTIVGICIVTLLYILMVYLDLYPPRLLFIRGYYPWDITADPFYQLTMIGQWTVMLFILNGILAYNVLMNVVFMHVITQFRILRHKLENLRAHAVRNVLLRRDTREGETRKEEGRSYEIREGPAMECAQVTSEDNNYVIEDIDDDMNDSTHQQHEQHGLHNANDEENGELIVVNETVGLNMETEEFVESTFIVDDDALKVDLEMRRLLEECMEEYKLCRRGGDLLSRVFYVRLVYLIGWNLVGLIVLALYAKLAPGFDAKQFAALGVVVVGLIDFVILSAISSEITHQSSLIGESLYSCDWLNASEDFKRTMRIFMTAVNQPVVVYVAGFLPMSLETFLHVINNTYSYYLVMSDVTAR